MLDIVTVLKQTDIFHGLTSSELEIVASICEQKVFHRGEIIFVEGTTGDELYVIASGTVDILLGFSAVLDQSKSLSPVKLVTLRQGQSFGEIALIDRGLRSASAQAAEGHTQVLILAREALFDLCERYPQLGYRMMFNLAADLAAKIRNTDYHIQERILYGRSSGFER